MISPIVKTVIHWGLVTIFTGIILPQANAYDPHAEIESTDRARHAMHTHVSEALAQLNYIRMKTLAVDAALNNFTSASAVIKETCAQDQRDFVSCRDQIESLSSSVQNELSKIRQLQSSTRYLAIIKSALSAKLGIGQLLDQQRERLSQLNDQLITLRRSAGLAAAKAEFENIQSSTGQRNSEFANQATCKLAYPTARVRYVSAMQDLASAKEIPDGFLILRAQRKVREIDATLTILTQRCPNVDSSSLKAKLASIDPQQWNRSLKGAFDKACAELAGSDLAITDICHRRIMNDSAFFYIHQRLVKRGGK